MYSKAELERQKQRRRSIETKLLPKLESFHNYYLQSVLDWHLLQIQVQSEKFPMFSSWEEMKEGMVNKPYIDFGFPAVKKEFRTERYTFSNDHVYHLWLKKDSALRQLKNKAVTSFKILKEAETNYQSKINNFIDKMVVEQFNPYSLEVKEVKVKRGQVEILIYCPVLGTQFHARSIWAEGEINAPHYRFITTVKKLEEVE